MKFPTLPAPNTTRTKIDVFGGYNHNLKINDNEFYDMRNMSSDYFPLLSARKQRGVYAIPTNLKGLVAKDKLCYLADNSFVKSEIVNGELVTESQEISLTDGAKKLVSLGAYVIILPDKKYINSGNLADYGDIDFTTTQTGLRFSMCTILGAEYDITNIGAEPPTIPENKSPLYWIDTSSSPHSLKQYSYANETWNTIATSYIKIKAADTTAFSGFNEYDGIKISGITDESLTDLNGSATVYLKGEDYIVVSGLLKETKTLEEAVTFSRTMPDLDFVIESNNRLWGCRYYTDENGNTYNEIYASKLGDFKNWDSFLGISTDSYRVSVGTNGAFTGAIAHLGYPIFFKENYLHKIYGTQPSNYSVQTTACRGVQKGCGKSLAIVNEVLYYKSLSGVCAYDGSLPVEVSSELGDIVYYNASAGAHGNKYYISMCDKDNNYSLFVYDVAKRLWHKEDDSHILEFCSYENELYFINSEFGEIKTMFGYGLNPKEERTSIDWMVETGTMGFDTPDKKYVSNITIRLDLDFGSRIYMYIQYDSSGVYVPVCTLNGKNLKSVSVPIRPERCDHFRLKIVGYGYSKIYSITKTLEDGSER